MGEAARQHGPLDLGGLAPRRIILVGRTGIDATLRRDSGLELVRVNSALEAIGEAAAPPETDPAPLACIVVGPDADPAGAEREQFAAAVRSAAPDARLVLVSDAPNAPAGAYDAVVGTQMPFHALKAVLLRQPGAEPSPPVAGAPAPPAPQPPPRAAQFAPRTEPTVMVGESELLAALLAGRDVALVALERLRRESGVPDALLLPAGAGGPVAEGVTVEHKGRPLGRLVSPGGGAAATPALAAHAPLMAAWLALGEQQKELRRAALMDDLTGAYNRRYFDRYLRSAIEQAQRDRLVVTLLVFDIDDFKRFNDDHGHGAGDEILRETVRLLTSVIRPHDRVCRIGGDEFAVVFHEPTGPRDPASKPPSDIAAIARRFQEQVCAQRFPKLGYEAPGVLTISGGLAAFPWDGRTPEELLAKADALALESKRAGKNAITLGPGTRGHRPSA